MNSKLIKGLQDKKYREQTGLFIVQGEKAFLELINSDFEIDQVFCTPEFAQQRKRQIAGIRQTVIAASELETLGTFQANTSVLAIVKQKKVSFATDTFLQSFTDGAVGTIVLVLDGISDPGNLGTIIRIADWYGINTIIASPTTTDFYNPKTIAATMGSFTRIQMHYTPLEALLKSAQEKNIPILGTVLQGTDIHTLAVPEAAFVIIGGEANGISFALQRFISEQITIPRYGQAESLNAGIATAIVLDNLKQKGL